YVFDPDTGLIAIPDGASGVDAGNGTLEVTTGNGGQLTFHFIDFGQKSAGDYSYDALEVAGGQSESFEYTIVDGDGDPSKATLTVNVLGEPQLLRGFDTGEPIFPGAFITADNGIRSFTAVRLSQLRRNADVDAIAAAVGVAVVIDTSSGGAAKAAQVTITDTPDHGGAAVNPDQTVTYASDAGFEGVDKLTYEIVDTAGNLISETVFVNVSDGDVGVSTTGSDADETINGTVDNDNINGGLGADTLDAGEGDDILIGDEGNDVLIGGSGNDVLIGGAGDDSLFGGAGDDALIGGEGDDLLDGGEGDDFLDGGEGDDILAGGLGEDTLIGGPGADTFVLSDISLTDLIADYDQAEGDLIDLTALFDLAGLGPIDPAELSNFVSYDADTGALSVDPNGTGVADNFSQVATVESSAGVPAALGSITVIVDDTGGNTETTVI
ncbi:MAG: calcium-binding protein, partial [Methyloligellaceae bacterium]